MTTHTPANTPEQAYATLYDRRADTEYALKINVEQRDIGPAAENYQRCKQQEAAAAIAFVNACIDSRAACQPVQGTPPAACECCDDIYNCKHPDGMALKGERRRAAASPPAPSGASSDAPGDTVAVSREDARRAALACFVRANAMPDERARREYQGTARRLRGESTGFQGEATWGHEDSCGIWTADNAQCTRALSAALRTPQPAPPASEGKPEAREGERTWNGAEVKPAIPGTEPECQCPCCGKAHHSDPTVVIVGCEECGQYFTPRYSALRASRVRAPEGRPAGGVSVVQTRRETPESVRERFTPAPPPPAGKAGAD